MLCDTVDTAEWFEHVLHLGLHVPLIVLLHNNYYIRCMCITINLRIT